MAVDFDLSAVIFRCKHPRCREVFEKSLEELADADEVFCPRCGTPARVEADMKLLAAAQAATEEASIDKVTG
jgi:hypothetical protein